MASSSNVNGNLMDEFEEAFQNCLLSLTKLEANTGTNKEEVELEVQKTTNRFIDVARQMEAFFLQKRFLVSTLKPDQLIKDENQYLRIEIQRKEALLNKHYSRLEEWKSCLSDIQQNPAILNRPVGPGSGGLESGAGLAGPSGASTAAAAAAAAAAAMGMGGPQQQQQQPQRMMPNMPGGGGAMAGQMPQMSQGGAQQHLQNQKMLQAQQMQQFRMMGKLPK
ncbi:mediator of RNA polymerase II transcription subunit 28-like [Musca vetustissima]|uniref:mediator of RNA polymerase II transcription subunit 28-like n=1 Tax=Musca vetustissima TaxID=27455 RepID=UPI002AB7C5E7|nr:mediator of RNA polymerase II transcription subunit 28-like [Musca vetustissima]